MRQSRRNRGVHREERTNSNQGHLGILADTDPQQKQRNPRQGRHCTQRTNGRCGNQTHRRRQANQRTQHQAEHGTNTETNQHTLSRNRHVAAQLAALCQFNTGADHTVGGGQLNLGEHAVGAQNVPEGNQRQGKNQAQVLLTGERVRR